jgi:hypothetical protein
MSKCLQFDYAEQMKMSANSGYMSANHFPKADIFLSVTREESSFIYYLGKKLNVGF